MVLSNVHEYDKAMNIAELIHDKITDINQLCYIAECLREGCGNRQMLSTVVSRIIAGVESCSSDKIVSIMRICNDYLADYKLACRFANFILQNYQYFPIDGLRDAIWVFINVGDVECAKSATMALLQSVPGDIWATTVLNIIGKIDVSTVKTYASPMPPANIRGIALPRVVVHYSLVMLADCTVFDKKAMICLRGVANHCKVLSRSSDLTTSLIEGVLFEIEHVVLDEGNIVLWTQLVADGLLYALYPIDIMSVMFKKLLRYGYNGVLDINLGDKIYRFNTKLINYICYGSNVLHTMCILSILSRVSKQVSIKYYSHILQKDVEDCYLTASETAEKLAIELSVGALEELADILAWNTKRNAK